jgi:uncharacterized protein
VPEVALNTDAERFELLEDGVPVGRLEIRDEPDHRVLVHIELDEGHEGKGYAGILTQGALDQTRDAGLSVDVQCPYVQRWLERHPEYQDMVISTV